VNRNAAWYLNGDIPLRYPLKISLYKPGTSPDNKQSLYSTENINLWFYQPVSVFSLDSKFWKSDGFLRILTWIWIIRSLGVWRNRLRKLYPVAGKRTWTDPGGVSPQRALAVLFRLQSLSQERDSMNGLFGRTWNQTRNIRPQLKRNMPLPIERSIKFWPLNQRNRKRTDSHFAGRLMGKGKPLIGGTRSC